MTTEEMRKVASCTCAGSFPPGCETYNRDLCHMIEVSVAADAHPLGVTDPRRARAAAQGYIDRHTRTPGYRLTAEAAQLVGTKEIAVVVKWERLN